MAFKSKAQINTFFELHKAGKIGTETLAAWALRAPDIKNLPDHVSDNNLPVRDDHS